MLPPLFVILGPAAWLLWGWAAMLLYLSATGVFGLSIISAIFLQSRFPPMRQVALLSVAAVWLLLGLAAWVFTV
jgi:hypothetical protein